MEILNYKTVYSHFIRGSILQLIGYIGVSFMYISAQVEFFFLNTKYFIFPQYGLLFGVFLLSSYLLGQIIILIGIIEWIRGSRLLLKYVDRFSYLNIGWKTFMAGVLFSLPLPTIIFASLIMRLGDANTIYLQGPSTHISILEQITITTFFAGMVGFILIGIGYIIFALFLYEIGSEFSNNVKLKYGGFLLLVGALMLVSILGSSIGSILTIIGLTLIIIGFKELEKFRLTGEIGEFKV